MPVLPPLLPLFPLPNVVLFPRMPLALHVFEPRYRAMVSDALESHRAIGMVLLKPGWEADYEGRPPVYPVGCAGLIERCEKLADGRYDVYDVRAYREQTPAPASVAACRLRPPLKLARGT